MNTTVEILKEARELIYPERHWAKCNRKVELEDGTFSYCAAGAIESVTGLHILQFDGLKYLKAELPKSFETVVSFNDTHNHADVIALFDRAIARAESEAA